MLRPPCTPSTFTTENVDFKHLLQDGATCPQISNDNPSDLLTRTHSLATQCATSLWCVPPEWLNQYSPFWTERDDGSFAIPDSDPEVKCTTSCVTDVSESSWIQHICEYYSSFTKIVKSIAWIRKFAYFKVKRDCPSDLLSTSKFDCAHDILVRHIQSQSYEHEIDNLKAGKPLF